MVSFVIVDYNAGDLLSKCIDSISRNIKVKYEIVIFDNASADNEKTLLKTIENENNYCTIIYSKQNVGFAKANNRAVEFSQGKIIHFLNPDTTVDIDLNNVYTYINGEDNDYIYGTTLYEGTTLVGKENTIETIQNYFRKIINKDWKYYIGASVIVKKDVFYRIGGWPTDYFMYMEDTDLFYTAATKGILAKGVKVNVQHLGGGTTRKSWNNFELDLRKEIAVVKFYKKYNLLIDYFFRRLIFLIKHIGKDNGFFYNIKLIYKAWTLC